MVNSVTLSSHDEQPSERFSQAPEMRGALGLNFQETR